MLRVLAAALAVISLTTATLCFSAPKPPTLTPGITLIGKGVVSGSALATQIYAFAIEPALINFQQQILPDPLFPPGQVKKLIK